MNERFKLIHQAIVNVAARPKILRGPFVFRDQDEVDLQEQAKRSRKWLSENK
jgi:hypothetical protein